MSVKQPHGGAVFPPKRVYDRDWGTETLLVETDHYTMKEIAMKPREQGGLQYHHKKDESAYIVQGSAWVEYDAGDGRISQLRVSKGQTVRFPPGAVHRMTAGQLGVTYVESSTPYMNDRCHVERNYGFDVETGGLPSTTIDEVFKIPKGAGLPDG